MTEETRGKDRRGKDNERKGATGGFNDSESEACGSEKTG